MKYKGKKISLRPNIDASMQDKSNLRLTEDVLNDILQDRQDGGSGKVRVSKSDTTPDYLYNKIEAGANVTIAKLNPTLDEGISIASTTFAPLTAKYIVQEANAALTAEQSLGVLATGMVKNTTTAGVGVLSIAAASDLPAHNFLSAQHGDTLTGSVLDGDVIIGNVTPNWSRLAITIPAANIRNILAVDNAELRPSWKGSLDATAPTTISENASATAGTSLIFSHRDHVHGAPATWAATAHNLLSTVHGDATVGSAASGDIIYADANPKWTKLTKGNDGQVLTLASGLPSWATPGSGVTDHGLLTGLADDDHTQYLLVAGTRALSAAWDAGSFIITSAGFTTDAGSFILPNSQVENQTYGIYEGTVGLIRTFRPTGNDGYNLFIGGAGNNTMICAVASWYSSRNVAIGFNSFVNNTEGMGNVALGVDSLSKNTIGCYNFACGYKALEENTIGSTNIALGYLALNKNTAGDLNTAIGSGALGSNITGDYSVAIGYAAGYYETASSKLFIDNVARANEADGRVKSLIYGIFDAATANQWLYFNSNVYIRETLEFYSALEPNNDPGDAGQVLTSAGAATVPIWDDPSAGITVSPDAPGSPAEDDVWIDTDENTSVATATDEKSKVSANDTTAGYLNGKLVAGTGITLTEGSDAGNETLTIATGMLGGNWGVHVTYKDSDEIYVEAGKIDVNGTVVTVATQTAHTMTSMVVSTADFHYIYLSAAGAITDSATEPAWSDAKFGWYSGTTRCIGAVWVPSANPAILAPFISNVHHEYLLTGTNAVIATPVSAQTPTGAWIDLTTASDFTPVNATHDYVQMYDSHGSSTCSIYVSAIENKNLRAAIGVNGYYACSVSGWVQLGVSRDLAWEAEDDDTNLSAYVWISGYKVRV